MPSDRTSRIRPIASLPYGTYPARQFFDPEVPPVSPPVSPPPPTPPPGDPAALGDAGKKALDDERAARKVAETAQRAAEKRANDLEAANRKRDDDDAAKQGQFQKLAEDRKGEIDTLTTDRDGLKQQVDDLTARLKTFEDAAEADYQTAVKALPDELKDLAPEGDLTARRTWLGKAQKAAEKVAERKPTGGNPTNPAATGPASEQADKDAFARQASQTRL